MATSFVFKHSAKNQSAQLMPVICAWCKAKERTGDTWGPLRSDPSSPHASHGICPACFAREQAKLEHKR